MAPLSLWTPAAVSGGERGEKPLQRLRQAHHMDETKQSRQAAGKAEAWYSMVMEVVTRDSHSERGGHGTQQEGSGSLGGT